MRHIQRGRYKEWDSNGYGEASSSEIEISSTFFCSQIHFLERERYIDIWTEKERDRERKGEKDRERDNDRNRDRDKDGDIYIKRVI